MKRLSLAITLVIVLTAAASAWEFRDASDPSMTWNRPLDPTAGPNASCVAWGDVNNDGYPDLFAGSSNQVGSKLYISNGRDFSDQTEAYSLQSVNYVRSAQLVDYDRDGLLDLLCLTGDGAAIELYRQNAQNRFQPVDLNLQNSRHPVLATIWDDFDNDGQLDLILNRGGERDTEIAGLVNSGSTFSPARAPVLPEGLDDATTLSMIDYNSDGLLDIVLGSETDAHVLRNHRDAEWVESRELLGLPANLAAQGIAWADFNQDGLLDIVTCGAYEETYLFIARAENGAIVYEDQVRHHGWFRRHAAAVTGASSVHCVDANRDGWTDIFYVGSNQGDNFLLLNNNGQGWRYDEAAAHTLGLSGADNRACAWTDCDNDGDLDVAFAIGEAGVRVYHNYADNRNEYFRLRLADATSGQQLLNCQVFVKFPESRGWSTTSMASSASGCEANDCFFVNSATSHSRYVDIKVIWPSGAISRLGINDIDMYTTTILTAPVAPDEGADQDIMVPIPDPALEAVLTNTPNPFNPSTTVEYAVPAAGFVTLSIYNVLGQEVASLVNDYKEVGFHKVNFNASALPSGLYIARLQTATTTQLHRMILTK